MSVAWCRNQIRDASRYFSGVSIGEITALFARNQLGIALLRETYKEIASQIRADVGKV